MGLNKVLNLKYGYFFDSSGNSYYQFYQNSNANSRPDGSALVSGDTWFDTTDNTEWRWNGTCWLSSQEYCAFTLLSTTLSATSSGNAIPFVHSRVTNAFIKDFRITGRVESAMSPGGAIDSASNYWEFNIGTTAGATNTNVPGSPTLTMQNGTWTAFYNLQLDSGNVNTLITSSPTSSVNNSNSLARRFYFTATKIGSASNLTGITCNIKYQLVR